MLSPNGTDRLFRESRIWLVGTPPSLDNQNDDFKEKGRGEVIKTVPRVKGGCLPVGGLAMTGNSLHSGRIDPALQTPGMSCEGGGRGDCLI